MILFPLTSDDKSQLKRLTDNKPLVFALKKLFLNACTHTPASNEAIEKVTNAFHTLENLQPDSRSGSQEENLL